MPHSLEWVECKRKIFLLDRAPSCLFFFSSHVRLLLEVSTLSIKCSKTLYFRKSAVKLISFRLKTYQVYCNRLLCFSKERSAYFCPKGGVLSSLYYLKSNYNGNWTDRVECNLVWNHTRDFSSIWNHKSVLSDQNCTPLRSITTLLQPFWNSRIQSVISYPVCSKVETKRLLHPILYSKLKWCDLEKMWFRAKNSVIRE